MIALPHIPSPKRSYEKGVIVHENPFETITKTKVYFDGFEKDYYIVNFGPRAGVVAVKEGCVLLSAQYRFLIDGISWELPGGRVDEGEDSINAAYRECLEETGIECFNLKPLVTYRPGLDNVENLTQIFYTEEVNAASSFRADPTESLAIDWIPIEDAVSFVLTHQITDAMTVSGILAFAALKR